MKGAVLTLGGGLLITGLAILFASEVSYTQGAACGEGQVCVFLVTSVDQVAFGDDSIAERKNCSFQGGGLCGTEGGDAPIQFAVFMGPFDSRFKANVAYCDDIIDGPRGVPLTAKRIAKFATDGNWHGINNAGLSCPAPDEPPPAQNHPPTVTLTMNPSSPTVEDTIHFAASASDPDGDPLTYSWTLDGQGQSASGSSVQWSTPSEGSHTIQVQVSDGKGGTDRSSITFVVESGNRPPRVRLSISPEEPTVDDSITFTATASDPDNDELDFEWTLDGERQNASSAVVTWSSPTAGQHTISVEVSDGKGGKDQDSLSFRVSECATTSSSPLERSQALRAVADGQPQQANGVCSKNEPPSVTLSMTPPNSTSGDKYSFTARASDPDGDELTYEWFLDGERMTAGGSVATLSRSSLTKGHHTVTVRVSDGNGGKDEDSFSFVVSNIPPKVSLRFYPTEPTTMSTIQFFAQVFDPDSDSLDYKWFFDGREQSSSGASASWGSLSTGSHTASVVVSDGDGGTDQESVSFEVKFPPKCPTQPGAWFTDCTKKKINGVNVVVVVAAGGTGGAALLPGPHQLGLGLTSAGLWVTSGILMGLVNDPPDPNFKTIVQPKIPSFPLVAVEPGTTQELADAFNALLNNLAQSLGIAEALLISGERFQGALQAGDEFWQTKQLDETKRLSSRLAALLEVQPGLYEGIQTAWRAAGLADLSVSMENVSSFQSQIASEGLPSSIVAILNQLGGRLTTEDVKQLILMQEPQASTGNLFEQLANPALAAGLQEMADELDTFASSNGTTPPSGNQSIAQALDANGNGVLDDLEVRKAIQLWILGDVVPGTDNLVINDPLMKRLVQMWILGTPVDQASAAQARGQPTAAGLRVESLRLSAPAPEERTLRVEGQNVAAVHLQLFDLSGRLLLERERPGSSLRFALRDAAGHPLANGTYLYAVTAWGPNGERWSRAATLLVLR